MIIDKFLLLCNVALSNSAKNIEQKKENGWCCVLPIVQLRQKKVEEKITNIQCKVYTIHKYIHKLGQYRDYTTLYIQKSTGLQYTSHWNIQQELVLGKIDIQ